MTPSNLSGVAVIDPLLLSAEEQADQQCQALREWSSKPAMERTQLTAERTWPRKEGDNRYRVMLHRLQRTSDTKGRPVRAMLPSPLYENPAVDLWASDEEMAQSRYQKLCGIRAFDIDIVEIRAQRIEEDALPLAPHEAPVDREVPTLSNF